MDLVANFRKRSIVVLTENVTEQIDVQNLLYGLGFYWLDGSRNTNSHTYSEAVGIAIGLTLRINGFVEKIDLAENDYFKCNMDELKKAIPILSIESGNKPTKVDIQKQLTDIGSIDPETISPLQQKLISEFHSKIFIRTAEGAESCTIQHQK